MGARRVGHGELLLVVDAQHQLAVAGDGAGGDVGLGAVEDVAVLQVLVGVDGGQGVGGAGEVLDLGLAVGAGVLVVDVDLVGGVGVGLPLGGVGDAARDVGGGGGVPVDEGVALGALVGRGGRGFGAVVEAAGHLGLGAGGRVGARRVGHGELLLVVDLEYRAPVAFDQTREHVISVTINDIPRFLGHHIRERKRNQLIRRAGLSQRLERLAIFAIFLVVIFNVVFG